MINGAGAAGAAITRLLLHCGVTNIVVCDRTGAIHSGRPGLTDLKQWIAEYTNGELTSGSLSDVIASADAFVGVSARDTLSVADVKRMADKAIVFALANPDPEISPEDAAGHVAVMATGRSDYPNQINNVLCFPGLFRGLLDVRASGVNDQMKVAAAEAIASTISENELHPEYIVPSVFDRRVASAVADAVSRTAIETGFAKRPQVPGMPAETHQ